MSPSLRTHYSPTQIPLPLAQEIEVQQQQRISDLLRLQRAAQEINSILDLDSLLDKIVNDVVLGFGCIEASVLLKDDRNNELVLGAVKGCDIHQKGFRFAIGRDGLVGMVAASGKTYYAPNVDREPIFIRCKESTRSELDIPLQLRGRTIGVFCLAHPELDGFPPEKIEILEALAAHIAIAVENARIFQEERLEIHRMRSEQEEAGSLQMRLMPKAFPKVEGLTVQSSFLPARAVGGDWYDFIPLPNRRWAFVLADVSGKGMAAALLMASVRGIVRSLAHTVSSPEMVLERLNRILVDDLPDERYVTMIFAVYNPETQEISIANAGHPWPLLVEPGSSKFLDDGSGIPLGLMEAQYPLTQFVLPPNSKLLFYTDGITEAESMDDEQFGMSRLEILMREPGSAPADIMDAVCRFTLDHCATDDATAVLLSR